MMTVAQGIYREGIQVYQKLPNVFSGYLFQCLLTVKVFW